MSKNKIFIALLIIFNGSTFLEANEKSTRGSAGWGFFAEFLWALNHIHYCIQNNKTPVIYWDQDYAYYLQKGYNGSNNGWEYYFEPVSNLKYETGDPLIKTIYQEKDFSTIWNYYQYVEGLHLLEHDTTNKFINITNPSFNVSHRYPTGNKHLYDEEFRKYVNEKIIKNYVNPKKVILDKVNSFVQKFFSGKRTIGIHLRGGFLGNESSFVPTEKILAEANKYANKNTQFFIATDQIPLLQMAQKRLKGKVLYIETQRFDKTSSPYPGKKLHPSLGEDLLIETLLLSKCDYFIHTISQVSTSVLYFNPTLKHTLLY